MPTNPIIFTIKLSTHGFRIYNQNSAIGFQLQVRFYAWYSHFHSRFSSWCSSPQPQLSAWFSIPHSNFDDQISSQQSTFTVLLPWARLNVLPNFQRLFTANHVSSEPFVSPLIWGCDKSDVAWFSEDAQREGKETQLLLEYICENFHRHQNPSG